MKYKYWIFYISPEIVDDIFIEINDSYIYGYTQDRDLAGKFEEIHDMRYFRKKKILLDVKDVHELAANEHNKILSNSIFTTIKNGIRVDVNIPTTLEEVMLMDMRVYSVLQKFSLKMDLPNPFLCEYELSKALNELKFVNFYKFQSGNVDGSPIDPASFDIFIDDLAIYIDVFSKILRV